MAYCRKCGNQIDIDSEFCSNCGEKVVKIVSTKTEKKGNEKKITMEQNEKDLKNLIDASNTGVALAWFQIIISFILFLIGFLGVDLEEYYYGFTDFVFYVSFSIMMIILSKRLKSMQSIRIKKYLNVLLISTIIIIGLSLLGGGSVGLLWFLYIFSLIKAIKSSSKLEERGGYFNEEDVDIKFKTPHWIMLGVFSLILIIVGFNFDYDASFSREEYISNYVYYCTSGESTYEDYCNCAAEFTVNSYTESELIKLDNLSAENEYNLTNSEIKFLENYEDRLFSACSFYLRSE